MSDFLLELMKDKIESIETKCREEGMEKGRAEGRIEGISIGCNETLNKLLSQGIITKEQAAQFQS